MIIVIIQIYHASERGKNHSCDFFAFESESEKKIYEIELQF